MFYGIEWFKSFSYIVPVFILCLLFIDYNILGNCDNLVLANPLQTLREWHMVFEWAH